MQQKDVYELVKRPTATAVFDQEFKTIKLSDYRKYVILFFYPLDF